MTLVSFEGGAIACTGKRAGGADRFGREARAGDGGALGGPGWSGAGVAAVRMSLPDTPRNERMH